MATESSEGVWVEAGRQGRHLDGMVPGSIRSTQGRWIYLDASAIRVLI
jgi:hypothetical protein